jgi:hypothetical protein
LTIWVAVVVIENLALQPDTVLSPHCMHLAHGEFGTGLHIHPLMVKHSTRMLFAPEQVQEELAGQLSSAASDQG